MDSELRPAALGKKKMRSKEIGPARSEKDRSSPKKARKTPRQAGPDLRGMRICLGCRESFLRSDLIRVVCDGEGHLLIDRFLKAPGRGAHLCYDPACIEKAFKRKALTHAFEKPIILPDVKAFVGSVLSAVQARIEDLLSIGRRMGQTVSGMDMLERSFSRLSALVISTEASASTKEKLEHLAEIHGCPVWCFGENESLGHLQGKEQRVAVGILDPHLAERLALEFTRRDRLSVATVG